MQNITHKSHLQLKAESMNMTLTEYKVVNAVINKVRDLVIENACHSICHHCLMEETCEKYGKPEACIKTQQFRDWEDIIERINLKDLCAHVNH